MTHKKRKIKIQNSFFSGVHVEAERDEVNPVRNIGKVGKIRMKEGFLSRERMAVQQSGHF